MTRLEEELRFTIGAKDEDADRSPTIARHGNAHGMMRTHIVCGFARGAIVRTPVREIEAEVTWQPQVRPRMDTVSRTPELERGSSVGDGILERLVTWRPSKTIPLMRRKIIHKLR